jgi:hypothetical protein
MPCQRPASALVVGQGSKVSGVEGVGGGYVMYVKVAVTGAVPGAPLPVGAVFTFTGSGTSVQLAPYAVAVSRSRAAVSHA